MKAIEQTAIADGKMMSKEGNGDSRITNKRHEFNTKCARGPSPLWTHLISINIVSFGGFSKQFLISWLTATVKASHR